MHTSFEQAYQILNPLQQAAVDHIEQGPLLLIAGPGTGKTQVLSLRIANILRKTDARPDTILALTFTEAAAKNMRERLLQIIGKDAYYVNISTFHAFCRQVIAEHGEYFPLQRDSEHLTDLERYQMFESLLDEFKPEHLRPLNDQYFYVNDIIKAISDLKREGVSLAQFEALVDAQEQEFEELQASIKSKSKLDRFKKQWLKNKNLLLLYQHYQQRLSEAQRFDYDDMINFVVQAFGEHELLLREYQENLHYFLVDEYQDTNSAQNKLVNLLAAYWEERDGMADLFAVGDPNQAIYRFQGASVENVLSFTRSYPTAKVITLDTAYRCPQNIYDLATELIAYNKLSNFSSTPDNSLPRIELVTKLKSPKGVAAPLQLFKAPSQVIEAVAVAEQIQALKQEGVAYQEIAILYRNHSDATAIIEALEKWQIPFELSKGDDVLQNPYIDELLSLLRLLEQVRRGEETDLLYRVMSLAWTGLDKLTVMKLGRVAGKKRQDLFALLQQPLASINQDLVSQEISEADFAPVSAFIAKLQEFIVKDQQSTFPHFFEVIISTTGFGFLPFLQTLPDSCEQLMSLNALFAQIKALAVQNHQLKLADLLTQLEIYRQHRIKIQSEHIVKDVARVQLSTVHSAKGMEWEHVFLIGLVDKKWGNQRDKNKLKLPEGIIKNTDLSEKERNEDERRLFYVALTRAKQQLYLSYPEQIIDNGQSSDKFPSIFLTEIQEIEDKTGQQFIETDAKSKLLADAEVHVARLLAAPPPTPPSADKRAFIATLVKDFQLSVTALNSYLRSPQEFLDGNLLRIPRAKQTFMSFGTAAHAALEQFFKLAKQSQQPPTVDFLLQAFEMALRREVLTEGDFEDRLRYGREVLSSYYQARLSEALPPVFDIERSFGAGRPAYLGDIPLSGKIDRIDLIDRERGLLRVYDYKTGKPKTRGGIEAGSKTYWQGFSERELALPESIKGPYKRQLIFYKLLLGLDRSLNPNWQVTEAVFEFIEPKEKGSSEHITHAYSITDEEVQELKQLIRQVMTEIRSLSFLDQLEF
jgi:DNA helicase II / ATP-dependent DNA helicase PcrA